MSSGSRVTLSATPSATPDDAGCRSDEPGVTQGWQQALALDPKKRKMTLLWVGQVSNLEASEQRRMNAKNEGTTGLPSASVETG